MNSNRWISVWTVTSSTSSLFSLTKLAVTRLRLTYISQTDFMVWRRGHFFVNDNVHMCNLTSQQLNDVIWELGGGWWGSVLGRYHPEKVKSNSLNENVANLPPAHVKQRWILALTLIMSMSLFWLYTYLNDACAADKRLLMSARK